MLTKLKIGTRLVLLIAAQTIVLVVIGVTALVGLNFASNTTAALNTSVIEQVKLNQLNENVREDLLGTINKVSVGKLTWDEASADLLAAKNLFVNNWDEYKEEKTKAEIDNINASLGDEYSAVVEAFSRLDSILEKRDRAAYTQFVDSELPKLVTPFLVELNERVSGQELTSEQLFEESIRKSETTLTASTIVMVFGLLGAALLGYFIYLGITRSIKNISNTVAEVAKGNYYARTETKGTDELADLGEAFNKLLDDKVATLVQTEKENEQLNESVISLLEAVSKLSRRDLTIKVPVTEDVTGPVADALNQFTTETSRVLQGVRRISEEVAKVSAMVKKQSDNVISVAFDESREVQETASELAIAVEAMNNIAGLAQACNSAAENAINTTHTALETVTGTIDGINDIRGTIHETEKRIKRLGERSQEISRAVNLINSISERTHILALNASMHAASAGEAGKSFAVVADEVQRLAENARDATAQISTLVSNIQVDTADTVTTMNDVITQVVNGTKLAEEAGSQMKKTQESTATLVESVRQIAATSRDQVRLGHELQSRAVQIQQSTQKTSEQLHEQTNQTNRLVECARGLLNAVNVFSLPDMSQARVKLTPVPAGSSAGTVQQKSAP
jgi:methyl-accepting chemotaxis protein